MKSRSKQSHFWVGQPVSDSLNSAVRFLCVVKALEIHVAHKGFPVVQDSTGTHQVAQCLMIFWGSVSVNSTNSLYSYFHLEQKSNIKYTIV